jgi:hypothetical protein
MDAARYALDPPGGYVIEELTNFAIVQPADSVCKFQTPHTDIIQDLNTGAEDALTDVVFTVISVCLGKEVAEIR